MANTKLDDKFFREYRCKKCRALLFEEYVFVGRIRVKCKKCKTMNTVRFKSAQNLITPKSSETQ